LRDRFCFFPKPLRRRVSGEEAARLLSADEPDTVSVITFINLMRMDTERCVLDVMEAVSAESARHPSYGRIHRKHLAGFCSIQPMEGLSMGFAGVAIPAADFMKGTGHAGGGLGVIIMAYSGAALGSALSSLVAQAFGFPAAFLSLGAAAAIGLSVWIIGLCAQAGAICNKPQAPPADKVA
jgi:hypothetical protein